MRKIVANAVFGFIALGMTVAILGMLTILGGGIFGADGVKDSGILMLKIGAIAACGPPFLYVMTVLLLAMIRI